MENFLKDLFFKFKIYNVAKKILVKPYTKFIGFKFNFSSKQAISNFVDCLNNNGYNYWLEFGTLLGAVREKGLIAHDFDIDVAMFIDEYDKNMEKNLAKQGFKLVKRAKFLSGEIIEETYKYKLAQIDIFYAYKVEGEIKIFDYQTLDGLSPNECIKRYGGLSVHENILSKFQLIKYNFLNSAVQIPDNADIHLEELYGKDYMIKNKNWSIESRRVRKKTDKYAVVEYY